MNKEEKQKGTQKQREENCSLQFSDRHHGTLCRNMLCKPCTSFRKEGEEITLNQIKERKAQLEKTILTMLQEFSDSNKVGINKINLDMRFPEQLGIVQSVTLEVKF